MTVKVWGQVDPKKPERSHWRDWMEARADRIEQKLGLDALPFPGDQPADVWSGAFLTHTPLDVGGPDAYATLVRARIAAGECSGVFVYGEKDDPLAPNGIQAALIKSGPPCHVEWSPKNVTNLVGLHGWCTAWPADWRPYVRVAYWQEPLGDFGADGQPPISKWQSDAAFLAATCAPYGIASMAHMETWSLSPNNPAHVADAAKTAAMIDGVKELLTAVTWSYFVFDETDRAELLVAAAAEFMVTFPSLAWGLTAVGISVPVTLEQTDPRRARRAELLGAVYDEVATYDATMAGCYALPHGPHKDDKGRFDRDFYDGQVAAATRAARKQLEG